MDSPVPDGGCRSRWEQLNAIGRIPHEWMRLPQSHRVWQNAPFLLRGAVGFGIMTSNVEHGM